MFKLKYSFEKIIIVIVLCARIVNSKTIEVSAYSKVSSETNSTDSDGPVIHKALHTDLWFPTVFNSTERSEEIEVSTTAESTGRAIMDYQPFPIRRPYVNRRPLPRHKPSPVYPSYQAAYNKAEYDKLHGKAPAMNRFTPGEAVASELYKNKNKGYNYNPPISSASKPAARQPPPELSSSAATSSDTYVPPRNLYAFPPNIDSNYTPSPGKPKNTISSYIPPATGPVDSFNGFYGPVSPDLLPENLKNDPKDNSENSDMAKDNAAENVDSAGTMENMAPDQNGGNQDANGNNAGDDTDNDTDNSPGVLDASHQDQDSPDHDPNNDEPVESDTPPPGYTSDDDSDFPPHHDDHDFHQFHHHDHHPHHDFTSWDSSPTFYGHHGVDAYPEVIYDHDPHHYDHHPHIVVMPMTTTTTTTEEPEIIEEIPEPRVKKYSYFYIGRKLWYIPLYFTVWFSFYILFLIIKSIARHKVDLPNHTISRRSIISVDEWNHKEVTERIDELTENIMSRVENFKEKYL